MAEVALPVSIDETRQTHNTTTHVDVNTIVAASLDATTDYFIIGISQFNGSNTSTNDYEHLLEFEGSVLQYSRGRIEPRRSGVADSHGHSVARKVTTDASPADLNQQIGLEAGSSTVQTHRNYLAALKLDDTDADGLHSDNYGFSQTDTDVDVAVASTWYDGEELTIGNGGDDYLIIGFGQWGGGGAGVGHTRQGRLNVGGSTFGHYSTEVGDVNELLCRTVITVATAPASGTVVKNQYTSTSTLASVSGNEIIAINLTESFEDYAFIVDTTLTTIDTADTDFIGATLTHTTVHAGDVARDWFFLAQGMVDANAASTCRIDSRLTQGGTLLVGDDTGSAMNPQGSNELMQATLLNTKNIADNTDIDIDIIFQEEGAPSADPDIVECTIVGFTLEKAATGSSIPAIINSYRQRHNFSIG